MCVINATAPSRRTEVPGSLRFFAMEELEGNHYVVWKEVLDSIRTGATTQPGQQRDGDNEKGDRIHRYPGDENDAPSQSCGSLSLGAGRRGQSVVFP
jgi:hypothetical protein